MSELRKLFGEARLVKIGELELNLRPLTVSSIPLFMELNKSEKQAEAMREIISRTLKDAVPDATDEEIDNIPLEHMTQLMESIMEINKLGDVNEDKKALIEKIKRGQSA